MFGIYVNFNSILMVLLRSSTVLKEQQRKPIETSTYQINYSATFLKIFTRALLEI